MGRTDFVDVERTRVKSETAARLEFLVGEHVEAFGSFTFLSDFQHISRHQMGLGAPNVGNFFGLAGAGRSARAMPTALYLVITPTRVLATSDPGQARGATRDRVFGAWDRATTSIEIEDRPPDGDSGNAGSKVTLHLIDEDRPVQLESFDGGSDANQEILTLLRR